MLRAGGEPGERSGPHGPAAVRTEGRRVIGRSSRRRVRGAVLGFVWALLATPATCAAPEVSELDPATAGRLARLALDCVHREYPNKIAHVLSSDADVKPPRRLTPAFFGCFDWHSAVHGHWLLARLARVFPKADFAEPARAALARNLTTEKIRDEVAYFDGDGRVSFERPYGLAWLLQLAAELREWDDASAAGWSRAVQPLEQLAAARLRDWLPKLTHPIRAGEHSQTAFAFALAWDWALQAGDAELTALLSARIEAFYARDRDCPLSYEPSGQDFLSPCLAEADLMRRVLAPPRFAAWLGRFLPEIPLGPNEPSAAPWLTPAVVTDPSDPKLAHLDGLNLSRAWMLEGIAQGLPADDPRVAALSVAARQHAAAGLASVTGEHYEGGHWLGSFATYLVTARGLPAATGSGR
ncbi:MAG: DUF2891 domain-containing protein [Acidobacteriota bacterium]|nr:MAG: DUF2891 domain-containing protein [Acidobacteriota bacterium]